MLEMMRPAPPGAITPSELFEHYGDAVEVDSQDCLR